MFTNSGECSDEVGLSLDDRQTLPLCPPKFFLGKVENDEPLPFTNSGECSDEVVFSFDEGKKLYASENFLCYASPVFKAMFQHDFKEKETKEVAMKEKEYDDFLEFLLCLHPGVQKPIDNANVLRVVAFAEEYQVAISVEKCQNVMEDWVSSEVESALQIKSKSKVATARYAKTCLDILIKSDACGFNELVTYAISEIARFGHEVINGTVKISTNDKPQKAPVVIPTTSASSGFSFDRTQFKFGTGYNATDTINVQKATTGVSFALPPLVVLASKQECPVKGCKERFDNLREELKVRLFLQRLKLCDNGEMR